MKASQNGGSSFDPGIESAIEELIGLVKNRYPDATFEVGEGEDPIGAYIWAIVDVEDTDAVLDVVIDRLLELQIEQQLPIYLIPTRPLRSAAGQRAVRRKSFDYLFSESSAAR